MWRAQIFTLHASSSTTVVWPGEYLELDIPPDLGDDRILALQPRTDTPISKHTHTVKHTVNTSHKPKAIGRLPQVAYPGRALSPTPSQIPTDQPSPVRPKCSPPFSAAVSVDPDNLLPDQSRLKFQQLLQEYDSVFDPKITGCNGAAGPIQATVNIGPVQPPQHKGCMQQYLHNQLVELQAMFDELEQANVFCRPEDLGITVEYLNPSFLVKKPSGGHRLVLMLRGTVNHSHPLCLTLTQPCTPSHPLKYCGVATPFHVYTRSAMGMPGSETALEEMMCHVLGDLIQEGCVTKLAEDLYCGGDSPETLLSNWRRVLESLDRCNLRLSPTTTIIARNPPPSSAGSGPKAPWLLAPTVSPCCLHALLPKVERPPFLYWLL